MMPDPHHATNPSAWDDLRILLDRPYVVLDTETTGLLDPEIVAVAVVSGDGGSLVNELVRPAKPIDPEASRITGIDAETVRDKPEFPEIEPQLTRAIAGKLVCIYNASYDLKVLSNTYGRYGLAPPPIEPWCVMKWFARVFGDWNKERGDYTWQPLSRAAEYFGVKQGAPHDALEDTLTTWRILQAAILRAGLRVEGMDPLFEG
ncbi:exonuclease domain-containing protein [Candidatus Bipolaricaulota bacterium]